jgi:hypothetical protein
MALPPQKGDLSQVSGNGGTKKICFLIEKEECAEIVDLCGKILHICFITVAFPKQSKQFFTLSSPARDQ